MNEVEMNIRKTLATVFDMNESEITASSNADNVEKWDSVNHMHLVVALEEEFNIEFSDEEALELISFELIRTIISNKV